MVFHKEILVEIVPYYLVPYLKFPILEIGTWGFGSKLLTTGGICLSDLVSQVMHLNWSRQLTELLFI